MGYNCHANYFFLIISVFTLVICDASLIVVSIFIINQQPKERTKIMKHEIEAIIKISNSKNIMVTLEQAKEWNADPEKFSYVCDTFGLFAEQEGTIEKVENALEKMLKDYSQKS